MSDLYARREGRKSGKERGSRSEKKRRNRENESEGIAIDRLLNIIFSARRNFSLFRFPSSPSPPFQERWKRETESGEREDFPPLRFRFYTCRLRTALADAVALLLVLSFVKPDERSRLEAPSFLFFLRAVDALRAGCRLRGLRDALLPSVAAAKNAKDDNREKSVKNSVEDA